MTIDFEPNCRDAMVLQDQFDLPSLSSLPSEDLHDSRVAPAQPLTHGPLNPNNAGLSKGLSKADLVGQLRNQIRAAESVTRIDGQPRVSSGCSAINRLLPGYGYQRGSLVQWLTGGGQAADYLSLLAAKEACADGGALVVFDPNNEFYPPAVAAIGINLDNLIVLKDPGFQRPLSGRFHVSRSEELSADLLWSIDQALRCPAVAAVWGPLGMVDERWFRRFQLSAEASGSLGLFVQPMSQARQPSWADVQWLVQSEVGRKAESRALRSTSSAVGAPVSAEGERQQLVRLQLARCRGTQTGKTVNLSINTITGNVQLARRDYEQSSRQIRNEKRDSKWQKASGRNSDASRTRDFG